LYQLVKKLFFSKSEFSILEAKFLKEPHCISSLKVVSPLFWQKLLEAVQTAFKTSQFLRQFLLFGVLVKKMEETRMWASMSDSDDDDVDNSTADRLWRMIQRAKYFFESDTACSNI